MVSFDTTIYTNTISTCYWYLGFRIILYRSSRWTILAATTLCHCASYRRSATTTWSAVLRRPPSTKTLPRAAATRAPTRVRTPPLNLYFTVQSAACHDCLYLCHHQFTHFSLTNTKMITPTPIPSHLTQFLSSCHISLPRSRFKCCLDLINFVEV